MKKKVLVVDIGGTHVKLMISRSETRKFDSGMKFSPKQLASEIKQHTRGWKYDSISIGFPSVVKNGRIKKDPKHLATGWIDWNFSKSLGKPTRVLNDAAMQALGSYHGGRMLFLGLGTGLGSTLVWKKNLLPLELGDLPYEGGIIEDVLGKAGLDRLGKRVMLVLGDEQDLALRELHMRREKRRRRREGKSHHTHDLPCDDLAFREAYELGVECFVEFHVGDDGFR